MTPAELWGALVLGTVSPIDAANEAKRIFEAAGDAVRARWVGFELGGYARVASTLATELGGGPPRLHERILDYRGPAGTDARGGSRRRFFTESLDELLEADRRARALPPNARLIVDGVSFDRSLYENIVRGFIGELQAELAAVGK